MAVHEERTPASLTRLELASLIDHTQVRAYATQVDIDELCDEAILHGFTAVAVNPAWTSYCTRRLAESPVKICVCVGFPLGTTTAHIKVEETKEAIQNGAHEIDMVINIGALKSGFPKFVEREILAVVKAAQGRPVKAILETGYLSDEEKVAVSEMGLRSGAAFVKTCTGFGKVGATVDDVRLLRQIVGDAMGVKAAGGIRTYRDAIRMLEAGATRIGTSASVDILSEMPPELQTFE